MSFKSVLNANATKVPLSYAEIFSLRCYAFQVRHFNPMANYLVTAARLNPVTSLVTIAAVAGVSLILISFTTYLYAKSFSKQDSNHFEGIYKEVYDKLPNGDRTTILAGKTIANLDDERIKDLNELISHLKKEDRNKAVFIVSGRNIKEIYNVVSRFSEEDAFDVLDIVKDCDLKKLAFITKALSSILSVDDDVDDIDNNIKLDDLIRASDVYDIFKNNNEKDALDAFNALGTLDAISFNSIKDMINMFRAPNKPDVLEVIKGLSSEEIIAMHSVINKCNHKDRKTMEGSDGSVAWVESDNNIAYSVFNMIKDFSGQGLDQINTFIDKFPEADRFNAMNMIKNLDDKPLKLTVAANISDIPNLKELFINFISSNIDDRNKGVVNEKLKQYNDKDFAALNDVLMSFYVKDNQGNMFDAFNIIQDFDVAKLDSIHNVLSKFDAPAVNKAEDDDDVDMITVGDRLEVLNIIQHFDVEKLALINEKIRQSDKVNLELLQTFANEYNEKQNAQDNDLTGSATDNNNSNSYLNLITNIQVVDHLASTANNLTVVNNADINMCCSINMEKNNTHLLQVVGEQQMYQQQISR